MHIEIIIVDASTEEIKYNVPSGLCVDIIQSDKMQLTYQKNIGLDNARGEIIFFLDDDLFLDKKYIEETLQVFFEDNRNKIGAVSGYISNQWGIISDKPDLFMRLLTFFRIYDGDHTPGSVSPSGVFIELNKMKPFSGIKKVDFVPGGCTAFRREVFENFRPPLEINKYGGEDKTFSRMIAETWNMVVCGDAKTEHYSAGGGARQSNFKETKSTVQFLLYIQKNYGMFEGRTLPLRLYYLVSGIRMYIISFLLLLSLIKCDKVSRWFMRASGYIAGSISSIKINKAF